MDIELLIEEVRKRPGLWDTSDEDYKDRNKKNTAWIQVSETIYHDFQTKHEAEQKVIVQNVMAKWKSVRDNFIRNLKKKTACTKSGSAARKLPHYIFEEQLRFLHKTREMRQTDTTIDETENDASIASDDLHTITMTDNENDYETISLSGTSETPTTSTITNRKRKKTTNIEDKISMFIDASLQNKEKKTSQPKEAVDDMAFFSSLLPTLQLLSNDDKLQFRIEVLQTLQRFKNTPTTNINQHMDPQYHLYNNAGSTHCTNVNQAQVYTMLHPVRPASNSSTASYFSQFSSESADSNKQYL